jgi:peptidoglycan-N-acetylglucosamine deacetylase
MKKIYLTIDDGPSLNFKEKVNFLYKNKIPAIFFCTGETLIKRPKDVVYAIKKGYVIGNHSYNHPYFSKISLEEAEEQIVKTEKIIDSLYEKAKVKRPIKLFRFPYVDKGSFDARNIQNILSKHHFSQLKFEGLCPGYVFMTNSKDIDISWTFDFMEWKIDDMKKLCAKLHNLSKRKCSDIVLIHDMTRTHKNFMNLMKKLKKENVEFVLPTFH